MFIYKKFKLVESYNFNKICFEDLYENFFKNILFRFIYVYIFIYVCI